MPIIVLSGEEELLISERVLELREKLLDPAWASFNLIRIERPELKDVADAATAVPFGPGNKVIIFDRCELFAKKRGGKDENDEPAAKSSTKARERALDDLQSSLASVAPATYLIFVCTGNFDKSLKISKIFEKLAQIEVFDKVKFFAGSSNMAMMNFCRKRANKFGATIEDPAISYLAESSEGDLRLIASEIEKAATYLACQRNKSITLEVVSELSPHYAGAFALLDYWLSGARAQVLATVEEIRSRQPSCLPLFAMMQNTLSKWISIKAAAERIMQSLPAGRGIQRRELSAAEISRRLEPEFKLNPYILTKECERVAKISLARLVERKCQLTELERCVKSGVLTDSQALILFLTR